MREPLRCRLGLHKFRRRPFLDPDGLLRWRHVCDRCDLPRYALVGVAE